MKLNLKAQINFLLFLFVILNSCSSDKHQLFNDTEINGTIESFVDKLSKNGFKDPRPIENNQIRMRGTFVGKDCELFVYGTDSTRTAYKVKVDLPVANNDSIRTTYEKCQELCSTLHGPGTKRYQKFNNSSRFLFNEPKIAKEIKSGDYTRFTTKTGTIYLVVRTGYISVIFLDRINNELRKKENVSEEPEFNY